MLVISKCVHFNHISMVVTTQSVPVGLLLGQTPSWIMSLSAYPSLLLAWWLTFVCPFDIFWRVLHSIPHLLFIVGIIASIRLEQHHPRDN